MARPDTGAHDQGRTVDRLTRTLTAALLVTALAACGGSSDGTASDEADGGERLDWEDSPLQVALWGDSAFSPGEDEEEFQARELEVQESIRSCMEDQGFEYTPFVHEVSAADDIWSDQQDDPVAWAKEHGFGWADGYDQPSEEMVEDPNMTHAESLDDAAREAYYEALWGTGPEISYDEDDNPVDAEGNVLTEDEVEQIHMSFEPDGCENAAYEEVFDIRQEPDQDDEAMQRLEELYTDLEDRVQSDPGMQALDEQYAACMAEAGHDGVDSEEQVWERLEAREQELEIWSDPFADYSEEEMAELSEEEFEAILEEDDGGPDAEKLAELKAFEIDLAVPHAECSLPIEQERLEVRFDLEQELVDDPANAELFERVRELHGSDA